MPKELTRGNILKIADKVLNLISSEVGESPTLKLLVLKECRSQADIEDILRLEEKDRTNRKDQP